jgi:nickel-dependent lactate racemase
LAAHLGAEIFNRFWPTGQIINHDCADDRELIYYGVTDGGRYVEMNRRYYECDLLIYQGNVASQAWKSYTGTGAVVGLASTRSIASHHSYHGIPEPGQKKRSKRHASVKEEMTSYLDEVTGKPVFYINAVNGSKGKIAGIFAGYAQEVKEPAWKLAERNFHKPVPQADVLIVGLPGAYSYGSADNTLIATVGALVPPRFSPDQPVLRDGGVVIAVSPTGGAINERMFPSYPEAIQLYRNYFSVREMVDHEADFANRPDYLHLYTHAYAYPAIHAFWLFYENEYTLQRASRVIMAGTSNPGAFRDVGILPAKDFSEAWKIATKYVGEDPVTVVAPTFWSKPRIKFDVKA